MSIELSSSVGFKVTVPDGSFLVEESSAGPGTQQISIPLDVLLSVVRDDEQIHSYADVLEWTEKMASYYTDQFSGTELMQGSLQSEGKEVYAVAVKFKDREETPRIATVIGLRFPTGEFFGLTMISVNADEDPQPDLQLIQNTVDGFALSA